MLKKVIPVLVSSLFCSLVVAGVTIDTSYEQVLFSNLISGLIIGLLYIVPTVIVLGVPSSILIDIIMKNSVRKYKKRIEMILYVIFGTVVAIALSLLISLDDGTTGINLLAFKPIFVLSLSCAVPFGACSILLNYGLSK
ncbi:putative membrane channel-forming protein YqfA (hemolysin III family) [Priestia aryabhattai]|uniref:hypothetical protein n=1 Tax=Priestia aryabhattai TaxID=412384 RepID=UPI0027E4F788|nr:hypothetical protein [Priestia aryabhattai]MDP9726872.1 putative membrane channel-forming protein YqfA (hemolysin III family) [Priestia aryabhattai]